MGTALPVVHDPLVALDAALAVIDFVDGDQTYVYGLSFGVGF